MGSEVLATMGPNLPERDFPCLQTSKKVSFKVNSGVRDSRVSTGISVSPVTPVFQSDYCKGLVETHHYVNHEMPVSSLDSSGAIIIPKLDSEQNYMTTATGISASSHMCCEGLNSAAIGCHRDSADYDPVALVQAHNLDAKDLGADVVPADRVCVNRQGIQFDSFSQHDVYGECAVTALASVVECTSMGTQVGMNHQSPHRNVINVPRSDAQLGLSVEHVDQHQGLTWSSVVTKNTLGGDVGSKAPSSKRKWVPKVVGNNHNTVRTTPGPNTFLSN
ncbi:hypothetical protein Nepgr_005240 [Nepenthes gracilis]|uniref:Uncharacterized protein n=1 Tax=Nepenthes gracilis TaxID=150966 RepID=A0AAD3S2Z7_NEPGR|nr:hypothetical protein Nepgr_005240 [Nepenthes gracilis]